MFEKQVKYQQSSNLHLNNVILASNQYPQIPQISELPIIIQQLFYISVIKLKSLILISKAVLANNSLSLFKFSFIYWQILHNDSLLQQLVMEEQSTRKGMNQYSQQPSPLSFVLKRINQSENQYLPVPNTRLIFYPSITPQSHSSVISFNNDHNPYTPAFVDSIGKEEVSVRECDFKKLFEAEILQKKDYKSKSSYQGSKKSTLIKPEPNSKYCLVCKETFTNYFTHINHPIHSKRIAESEATQYIEDLVEFVSNRNKKEAKQNIIKCQNLKRSECLSQTSLSKELMDRPSSTLFQSARKQLSRASKNQ